MQRLPPLLPCVSPCGRLRRSSRSRPPRSMKDSPVNGTSATVFGWTGWPISCRRRGSTGIAITGCSPRITSSGPPSRRSPSGGDWLVFRRNRCLSPAAGQEGQAPTAAQPEPVPPTTPPGAKGQTHGAGGRGVSFCVPLGVVATSGLERGQEAPRHLHDRVASSPISSGGCSS